MSDDLVARLRDPTLYACVQPTHYHGLDYGKGRAILNEAATALTEARAEIEALRGDLANERRVVTTQSEARVVAESELSTLRARVREVVGPFSRFDISHTDDIDDSALVFENEGGNIVLGHLRAARQLNEDLK